jgi:hypothetical protein
MKTGISVGLPVGQFENDMTLVRYAAIHLR